MTTSDALTNTLTTDPTVRAWMPVKAPREASDFLQQCARLLRDRVRVLQSTDEPRTPAAAWLLDHHSFLQFQIRETRSTLRPAFLRTLPKANGEYRIYAIAAALVASARDIIDAQSLAQFAPSLKANTDLRIGELWAFGAMLRLAILQRLLSDLDSEPVVSTSILSLRGLELVGWPELVESVSAVESTLRQDPAGVYAGMDFETRDFYRHAVERLARRCPLSEVALAEAARKCSQEAAARNDADQRTWHVGYYLIGSGARQFQQQAGCTRSLAVRTRNFVDRWPTALYLSGALLATALVLAGFAWFAGPFPLWLFPLLIIPATQAAFEIVNGLVSRVLEPRKLPSLDYSGGIPADHKTLVAVPTLLLSPASVTKIIQDLEIRYLANRDPNLYFALITDFPDAGEKHVEGDAVLDQCVAGIRALNVRYANGTPGHFYLMHRARRWNASESKWMGYERKRGKLNDLNQLLLGDGNWFDTIEGDLSLLKGTRYVITLDTDTQLPRDTAAKMVGAMAHPLNRPVMDPRTRTVREGYSVIRPRVAVSMESAGRSRLAQIFSGLVGFDPYATSVSDLYQDLQGQASFTGKGIYDVRAFDDAVGERFPENAILSHDLIEGEYARTGLLTSIEIIEDYPASYRAFCKRNHRWVRGDWQILPWLSPRTPAPFGRSESNPLPLLSRWKIFDNLRRSLFEIFVLSSFVAGWLFAPNGLRWTIAMLAMLQIAAYTDMLMSAVRMPDIRLVPAFLRNLGERFVRGHRDAFLNLIFIPHQAFLMADAMIRTLVRRFITRRHLLQWETMAQSELADVGVVERYLYAASLLSIILLFSLEHVNSLMALVCAFWIAAPFVAGWLNQPPTKPAELSHTDRVFLREAALRTWRFFADYCNAENHYLIPDNVQHDPFMEAHRISPTNLGLLLNADLAAADFGYLNVRELSDALQRTFATMEEMPRERGHFYNWYDTHTLEPLAPRYLSSVDSGNLGAALCTLRQGCLELIQAPVFQQQLLDGLHDHARRIRDELPYVRRTLGIMRPLGSLLRQLEWVPKDLFSLEAVLTDAQEIAKRVHEAVAAARVWLEKHGEISKSEELRYWDTLLAERFESAIAELYALAPWLEPEFESELRVNMCDANLRPLLDELSRIRTLAQLPDAYDTIRERVLEQLATPDGLYPALRTALERLLPRLTEAKANVLELTGKIQNIAFKAQRFQEEMDFQFLFDPKRKLLQIGFDADAGKLDGSCYDLLASEARTTVFLAIAKGDLPREAWFRLGRSLTAYGDHRSLVSWSGTMFEYLMPLLHTRSYEDSLLDRAARGAVAIQQAYARERRVPWGISESAHAGRDSRSQYQYRAFGVPALSARHDRAECIVVSPYSTMLALMVHPTQATANLRMLLTKAAWTRHGFYEALDYTARGPAFAPEPVRCFMAHHQGMGLLAIDNALLGRRMQERFHLDPQVQATEFLLQERMPALVEVIAEAAA